MNIWFEGYGKLGSENNIITKEERKFMRLRFCKTCGKHLPRKEMKYSQFCSDECKEYNISRISHPVMIPFSIRKGKTNI